MRQPGAEDRPHLVADPTDLQGLDVVGQEGHVLVEVLDVFGFVTRQERGGGKHVLARDGLLDPRLQARERPVVAGVLQHGLHVDEVERGQVVEVEHVRVQVVGRQDQVLQQPAVAVGLDAVGHFLGLDRGDAVRHRADAADPLHDLLGVQRIAAFQDRFQAAEHLAFALGLDDAVEGLFPGLSRLGLGVDREVALNAGQGAERHSLRHALTPGGVGLEGTSRGSRKALQFRSHASGDVVAVDVGDSLQIASRNGWNPEFHRRPGA